AAAPRRPVAAGLQARHLDHHARRADQPLRGRRLIGTSGSGQDGHNPAAERQAGQGHDTAERPTRAVVLHPDTRARQTRRLPEHGLAEAVSLATALPNLDILWAEVVRLPKVQPGMLFGSGKVQDLKSRIEADEVDLVLVDGPVSPVQQRNL